MSVSPAAGEPALAGLPIDTARLRREYHSRRPDVDDADQLVGFAEGGHRGSPATGTFTESHVLAFTQAVCDYRRGRGIDGPVYLGRDTRSLAGPAHQTAVEVLAGNGVRVVVQRDDVATPAPVISRAVVAHNRGGTNHLADGIVVTARHGPPDLGGIKYTPPNGGPADTDVRRWIEERANDLLLRDNVGVKRVPFAGAARAATTLREDLVAPYVEDLGGAIDMEAIRASGLELGVDPLGGAGVCYWNAIGKTHGLDIRFVNSVEGVGLTGREGRFRMAVVNDPDAGRCEVVTPAGGLLDANLFLAVAVRYLITHRPAWPVGAAVGKAMGCSGMIDRVVSKHGWKLFEVPDSFKWFAPGLYDGSVCFGGDESGGASFLRHDGSAWTTDADGLLTSLLAAEITVRTGKDPAEHARELTTEFGTPYRVRVEIPATPRQKDRLRRLAAAGVKETTLAGTPITAKLTRGPGNDAPIGGLKVVTATGWFVARPCETEEAYTLVAESYTDPAHLRTIVEDGRRIVAIAFAGGAG
jgi:phosphoglucomutase